MSAVLKGGILGIVIVLILSLAITPLVCDSIRQDNPEVKCNWGYNWDLFLRVWMHFASIILLMISFLVGVLIGRTVDIIKNRYALENRSLVKKLEQKKESLWPWEK